MNKPRRKELAEAVELLRRAMDIIESVSEQEQEAYDNMPEGLQESERGEQMSEYIDTLEEARYEVEEMIDSLDEIVEG